MTGEAESPERRDGRRWLVRGRVQRVGFRASVRRKALALGLSGHARNLADGRVEVVAAGAPDALAALRSWLDQGPPLARVDRVDDAGACQVEGTAFTTG